MLQRTHHTLIPSSKTDGLIAEMNFCEGKARRGNGAGTMTEEKRSHHRNSAGTFSGHHVHSSKPQKKPIGASVLRIGITLCALLCLPSCVYQPAIDAEGNVTVRKSNSIVRTQGELEYNYRKRNKTISNNPRYTEPVERIAARFTQVIDLPGTDWEFLVFNDHSANAFCLPGGKVGVNTGIFRLIGDDEELLAAVIGHEIAHTVANHANQRMGHAILMIIGAALVHEAVDRNDPGNAIAATAAFALGAYLLDSLPLSRVQERESDKIGAILMAKAGYDPRKSIELWKLLRHHHHHHGNKNPDFLRTHPDDDERIQALKDFMPIAMKHYRQSGHRQNK